MQHLIAALCQCILHAARWNSAISSFAAERPDAINLQLCCLFKIHRGSILLLQPYGLSKIVSAFATDAPKLVLEV